jgi:hypothetical protein
VAHPCPVESGGLDINVRQRTDFRGRLAYNVTNTSFTQEMTMKIHDSLPLLACGAVLVALAACTSPQKAPATADVAVSRNAVENAVQAGAGTLAPDEITMAREKMLKANQALAAKDYKLARELAMQAEADAKLAQSRANSTKATAAANALDADLRALRQEVDRNNNQ